MAAVGNVVAQDGVTLEDTMQAGNLKNSSEAIIDDFFVNVTLWRCYHHDSHCADCG
jgi:hypothetical protein